MEVISVIATVCQLLDFGHKVFVGYRKVSGAADGITEEHDRVGELADHLLKAVEYLKAQQAILGDGLDQYHATLCSRATSLVEEVSALLDAVRVRGRPGKWKCVRSAVKAMGMEKKFELLEQRLGQLSREVETERQKLENRMVREAQDRSHVTVSKGFDDIRTLQQQHLTLQKQTIELLTLNSRKPRDHGYEWEASDWIFVDDGLGPTYPFPVDLCMTLEDFFKVVQIRFRSRKLPGSRQLDRGHILISAENGKMPSTKENWSVNVTRGARLRISFIVGMWRGLSFSKCARCRKPYARAYKEGEFSTCNSCDLRILLVEPDKILFEPEDMAIGTGRNVYRDYKQRKRGKNAPPHETSKLRTEFAKQLAIKIASEEPSIDLVCRSLVAKWEPIFNLVHRYVFCRCVIRLGTPSRSRFDPELVSLVLDVCPRHNVTGVRRKDYGDLVSNRDDPYFDQYGGYDVFRAITSAAGAAQELGDFEMSKGEILGVLDKVDRSTQKKIFEELKFEVNECLLEHGCELPADSVEYIKKRQKKRAENVRSTLFGDETPEPLPQIKDAPIFKEVRDILAGRWDGRPHWSVSTTEGGRQVLT